MEAGAGQKLQRQLSVHEKLYYGSVAVHLAPVAGSSLDPSGLVFDATNKQAFTDAKLREQPVKHLGKEYEKLLVPSIPAADFTLKGKHDQQVQKWPCDL